MKLASIIILVTLGLSISNTPNQIEQIKLTKNKSLMGRKISVSTRKELMLIGFWNYSKQTELDQDGDKTSDKISFDIHFIRNKIFPFYNKTSLNISIKYSNGSIGELEIECSNTTRNINETYELKDLYYNCNLDNMKYKLKINDTITPIIKFKFYNDTNQVRDVAEGEIDKSSIADETINSIRSQNKTINYDIFYLDEIELSNNEIHLNGNYSGDYNNGTICLNLSGTPYNSSLTNNSIKFNATGTIDAYLHGNMTKISDDQYILIYAGQNVDDHVVYPVSNVFIEVLGFGNYRKSTDGLARNQLYLTGDQFSLNALKQHIQFNTTIYYNRNLRNLQQDNKVIMANGTRVSNDQKNDIVIYNITYYGTEDLTIVRMSPPSNIQFRNDGEKYEKLSTNIQMTIPPDVDLLEEGSTTFERMEKIRPDVNSSAFSIDFNVSQKIDVKKNNISIIKYHPYFNINATDEIPCTIKNVSTMYRIICKPKKDVFTEIVNMKIIIPESSNRKLRILQTGSNRTLLPPTDATGKIEYTYSDDGRRTFFRSSSGGLSGGAIAAIVACTVAVVAATIIVLLFLNRIPAGPPRIKTPTDMNLANSTSNINH